MDYTFDIANSTNDELMNKFISLHEYLDTILSDPEASKLADAIESELDRRLGTPNEPAPQPDSWVAHPTAAVIGAVFIIIAAVVSGGCLIIPAGIVVGGVWKAMYGKEKKA